MHSGDARPGLAQPSQAKAEALSLSEALVVISEAVRREPSTKLMGYRSPSRVDRFVDRCGR